MFVPIKHGKGKSQSGINGCIKGETSPLNTIQTFDPFLYLAMIVEQISEVVLINALQQPNSKLRIKCHISA